MFNVIQLQQAKNIENDGNVLIFTLPAEVLPKVKKKKKRKKSNFIFFLFVIRLDGKSVSP